MENSGYKKLALQDYREQISGINDHSPMGILITFCRNYQNISSISIKYVEESKLMPEGTIIGYINGRLIVNKSKFLNEYRYINNSWKLLSSQYSIRCFSRRQSASCELCRSTIIITGGLWHEKCVSLVHVNSNDKLNRLDFDGTDSYHYIFKQAVVNNGANITKCRTKLPVEMCKHSITQISPGMVIAIGGWLRGGISSRVFMGRYNNTDKDVNWTALSPLENGSSSHIAFTIGNKLIVAGGWGPNFTRFDNSYIFCIEKNTWSPGPKLPFPLSNALAIVHEAGQFAVIFGGLSNEGISREIILYTPDEGFIVQDKMIKLNSFDRVSQTIRVM